MIELLSAASRVAAVVGAAAILGSMVFDLCRGQNAPTCDPRFRGRVFLLAAVVLALGHCGLILSQALTLAKLSGTTPDWLGVISGTHVGKVWGLRAGFAAALLLTAIFGFASRSSMLAPRLGAALAVVYLGLGPWGGHAAGAESPWTVLLPNVVHVIATAAWAGALPSWLITVRAYGLSAASAPSTGALVRTLRRFSLLALLLMAVIVSTGIWLGQLYIETQGDLLGTRYGGLLLGKLALLSLALLFANRLRTAFLPKLRVAGANSPRALAAAAVRHVSVEIAAVGGILICAAWLAQTTPALHETAPVWWLPFRWSLAATWIDPALRPWIITSLPAVVFGVAAARGLRRPLLRVPAAVTAVAGLGVLAWAVAVPAYPDTYRRSQVPYLSLSVASGRALFLEHCTACHGSGGLGDGLLAASLPRPPANLSQPHTALHTGGDMYWWLTHGIPKSGMPAFGELLSEDDRWDLINFLRAFSQGFEGRVLRARIVPGRPWLAAIDFYIENASAPTELKGYRETDNVLLAFLGGADALARAQTLAAARPELLKRRTQVLIVPLAPLRVPTHFPYPVLTTGAAEIWSAYELLSRTVGDRGAPDRLGLDWTHAEFLVDRFGYLRARWIAQDDPLGWTDPASLFPELERLNAEPRLRPPPDDHVH